MFRLILILAAKKAGRALYGTAMNPPLNNEILRWCGPAYIRKQQKSDYMLLDTQIHTLYKLDHLKSDVGTSEQTMM